MSVAHAERLRMPTPLAAIASKQAACYLVRTDRVVGAGAWSDGARATIKIYGATLAPRV
jgi:hypothetical protein